MREVSLDKFLPPTLTKSKKDSGIFIQERCSNPKCRKILGSKVVKYTLRIKGEDKPYCSNCAKQIIRPQESTEADL